MTTANGTRSENSVILGRVIDIQTCYSQKETDDVDTDDSLSQGLRPGICMLSPLFNVCRPRVSIKSKENEDEGDNRDYVEILD